jgi:hypothetical protein
MKYLKFKIALPYRISRSFAAPKRDIKQIAIHRPTNTKAAIHQIMKQINGIGI